MSYIPVQNYVQTFNRNKSILVPITGAPPFTITVIDLFKFTGKIQINSVEFFNRTIDAPASGGNTFSAQLAISDTASTAPLFLETTPYTNPATLSPNGFVTGHLIFSSGTATLSEKNPANNTANKAVTSGATAALSTNFTTAIASTVDVDSFISLRIDETNMTTSTYQGHYDVVISWYPIESGSLVTPI